MKVGVIGRTAPLIEAARRIRSLGHDISFVWTCKAEDFYSCDASAFQKLAGELDCPFINTASVDDGQEFLRNQTADVAISINFVNVLPRQILQLFPFGVLNAHAGDLPRYRGNACPNWAILNGEKHVGLVVHVMTEELDSGSIYTKRFMELKADTYIGDIYEWIADETPALFVEAVEKIESGVEPEPQSSSRRPLRCYPRMPDDSRICWDAPAEEIYAVIRASSRPFSGAFSYLNGNLESKVVIMAAEIADVDFDFLAIPGQVCMCRGEDVYIACKDKLLVLTDYSVGGADRLTSFGLISKSMRNRLK